MIEYTEAERQIILHCCRCFQRDGRGITVTDGDGERNWIVTEEEGPRLFAKLEATLGGKLIDSVKGIA